MCHLPRNVTEAGGGWGSACRASRILCGCRGEDGVSAVELWTTLYESLQENHCLTSPSAPAPRQERDHLPWHHGSWPEASRTGAQCLPTVVGESLPVVLSWCLGAGHVNTASPPFTPTAPDREASSTPLRREPFILRCWGDQHPRAQFSRGGVVGRFRRK